jgi:hypothetical protein
MAAPLITYLAKIQSFLRLDSTSEREVLRELYTHLEERTQELHQAGLSEEEATERAVQYFGPPKVIGQGIYEAHSQGSWQQALLTAMPNLLFATLFALHLWQNVNWSVVVGIATLGMITYGWRHDKPVWLFPWLGYFLLLLLEFGSFLTSIPTSWGQLILFIYIPLAVWLLSLIAIQTVRHDWLYGSLMLLPIPILVSWLLVLQREGKPFELNSQVLHGSEPQIALCLLALAAIGITFIRLKQRTLKMSVLLAPELLIVMLIALCAKDTLGIYGLLTLTTLSLALLLSPILLEHTIGHWRLNHECEQQKFI